MTTSPKLSRRWVVRVLPRPRNDADREVHPHGCAIRVSASDAVIGHSMLEVPVWIYRLCRARRSNGTVTSLFSGCRARARSPGRRSAIRRRASVAVPQMDGQPRCAARYRSPTARRVVPRCWMDATPRSNRQSALHDCSAAQVSPTASTTCSDVDSRSRQLGSAKAPMAMTVRPAERSSRMATN